MVSAACPLCTIYLIEANSSDNSDLQTAEAEAVTLGAHIVSNSWICYGSYDCVDTKDFSQPGVLYTAGTGDEGYDNIGAPAALASVISVGGTVLAKSGSTYSESVWDGAGAGCATGVTKPTWQKDPSCTSRTEGDVSAIAWQVAEYDTYGYSGWFTVGGTSVATPMIAAVFALAGNAGAQDAGKKIWSLKKRKRGHELHYVSTGSDGSCGGSYLCQAGTKQFHTLFRAGRLGNAERREGILTMRMMLKVHFPADAANAAVKDGRLMKVMQSTMERLKPEAAYFTAVEGDRGGFIVFDLKDPSDIPSICEPFFIELGAKCHLAPVMTVDDVQAGIAKAFPGT